MVKSIALLLVGVILGWFLSKTLNGKISVQSQEVNSVKNVFSEKDNEEEFKKVQCHCPTVNSYSQSVSTAQSPPSSIESVPQKTQECIKLLKKSDILIWEQEWSKNIEKYLVDGDFLWKSRENRSIDQRLFRSVIGEYSGKIYLGEYPKISILLKLVITDGENSMMSVDYIDESGQSLGSGSMDGFDAKKELGFQSSDGLVHLTWHNGMLNYLPTINNYGFKFPANLDIGSNSQYDLYGLNENIEWKNVGRVELTRVK